VIREAQRWGFLGPSPASLQLGHSASFLKVIDAIEGVRSLPTRLADLGTGGGVPGLVLAASLPLAQVSLIEANQRRAAFLGEAVSFLGVDDRVTVVARRAEEIGRDALHRGSYDVVVARSFAGPAVTAECASPLLRVGGKLVVSEPPSAHRPEIEMARPGDGALRSPGSPALSSTPLPLPSDSTCWASEPSLGMSGLRWPEEGVSALGLRLGGMVNRRFHFVWLVLEEACPVRFPRRTGIPTKRPLW